MNGLFSRLFRDATAAPYLLHIGNTQKFIPFGSGLRREAHVNCAPFRHLVDNRC